MALNFTLAWVEYSNESPPRFLFYLAYIMDIPSIWMTVLFQKIPLSGGDHAGFQFLTACVTAFFSALIWAVLAGFIFRRKSIAGNNANTEK